MGLGEPDRQRGQVFVQALIRCEMLTGKKALSQLTPAVSKTIASRPDGLKTCQIDVEYLIAYATISHA